LALGSIAANMLFKSNENRTGVRVGVGNGTPGVSYINSNRNRFDYNNRFYCRIHLSLINSLPGSHAYLKMPIFALHVLAWSFNPFNLFCWGSGAPVHYVVNRSQNRCCGKSVRGMRTFTVFGFRVLSYKMKEDQTKRRMWEKLIVTGANPYARWSVLYRLGAFSVHVAE